MLDENRAKFNVWWEHAKLMDEFRGCTLAAAYAAWLAGKSSTGGAVVTPTIVKEIAQNEPPPPPAPPRKRGAKDPDALAAWIGRKKFGKKKFQKLSAKGKKK